MTRSYKDFMNEWDYDNPVNTRTIFLQHLQTAHEENDNPDSDCTNIFIEFRI